MIAATGGNGGFMERYSSKNLNLARANRRARNATRQESVLWHTFLKSYSVNFSRQYRVGNYILDFYAPSIKLAVELDGGQHYEDQAALYDKERSLYLNNLGIRVLRFTNTDVDKNLNSVIIAIRKAAGEKI